MKSYKPEKQTAKGIATSYQVIIILLMIALFFVTYLAFVGAIDKQISNQDEMLCRSAEKSGNIEYQNKCEEKYE